MSIEESIKNLRKFKNIKVLYGKYTMTNEQLSGLRQSIGNVLDELENLKNELDKKDKVIDLMAKELEKEYITYEPCYLDKDPECLKINCIKQYFYKKVEGEKMSKNEIKVKCNWCGNDLDIRNAYKAGNARGYGTYIKCEKCGKNKVLNEIDLTREMI